MKCLLDQIEVFDNTRSGLGFSTDVVCDGCTKASTKYVQIGNTMFCKSCLVRLEDKINRAILGDVKCR